MQPAIIVITNERIKAMKKSIRIIALFISIVSLVSSVISCGTDNTVSDEVVSEMSGEVVESVSSAESGSDTVSVVPESSEETSSEEEKNYVFEIIYPTVSVSDFEIKLTEKDVEEVKDKISTAKKIFNSSQRSRADELRAAFYELLSIKVAFEAQKDFMHIQYYRDMSTDTWNEYQRVYNLYDEVHDAIWDFYNSAKNKSNVLADTLKEVVKTELNMRLVPAREDTYVDKMFALEGEYNSLKNSGASDEEMFDVFKQYLIAAEGALKGTGIKNYYEYQSKHTYIRTDTPEQRATVREYTKKYLVPICRQLRAKYKTYDNTLYPHEFTLSDQYLYSPYDSFEEDYLADYFSSLPLSSSKVMKDAFDKDRVIISDKKTAYKHAMVLTVGNTPICYFHKEYTKLDTMTHELGHYYADAIADTSDYAYSLKETHSSTNTMLFFSYLSNKLDSKAFTSAEIYDTYNWMYQTVRGIIEDEFDEIIYSRDPSTLTLEELNSIMIDLIDEYDVRNMSDNLVEQLMSYWKNYAISYSGKNYCYAVADIAAFQVYIKSKEDYDAATEMYRNIVEEPVDGGKFVPTIINAGLTSPYDEQTYIELQKLVDLE